MEQKEDVVAEINRQIDVFDHNFTLQQCATRDPATCVAISKPYPQCTWNCSKDAEHKRTFTLDFDERYTSLLVKLNLTAMQNQRRLTYFRVLMTSTLTSFSYVSDIGEVDTVECYPGTTLPWWVWLLIGILSLVVLVLLVLCLLFVLYKKGLLRTKIIYTHTCVKCKTKYSALKPIPDLRVIPILDPDKHTLVLNEVNKWGEVSFSITENTNNV